MRTTKILTILVLAFAIVFSQAEVSKAKPMGTAWTYQGRLMDANSPADGRYDFQFKLYYGPTDPNQVGGTADVNDLDVIDGYFTAELDFGSNVFDGNSVWLQTDVRPGDSNDPNAFVTLSPRQEVTPVPYALQTRGIFVDSRGNVGIGTISPTGKLHVDGGKAGKALHVRDGESIVLKAQDGGDAMLQGPGGIGGNIILQPGEGGRDYMGLRGRSGKVGIGTDKPDATLDVRGNVKITGGSPDEGKVLISDASGLASWQSLTVIGDGDWTVSGSDMYSIPSGKVGIGTTSPTAKMEVAYGSMNGKLCYFYDSGFPTPITHYSGVKGTYGATVEGHLAYRKQVMSFDPTYYGVYGSATTGGNNYGVYGQASGGAVNWAGYFNGNVYAGGKLGVGTTAPTANLDVKSTASNSDVIKAVASDDSVLFNLSEIGSGDGVIYLRNRDGTWKVRLSSYGYSLFNGGNVGIGDVGVPLEKLVVRGNILVKSESTGADVLELGEGLDYAEGFDVTEDAEIEAGTVLVIDSENPGKLTVSRSAYDSKVAGIVAGANGIGSGVRLGVGQFDHDVALAGRVFCKVDTTDAAVQPGDLLTTSGTAGYAMKVTDHERARGAVLGKAMESLEKGQKGQILVLVTLQ